MLKYLKVRNFRQFEEAEINFDDTAQITLISGRNGHGKSTLLEAIKFALWGVGRTPKTTLESLIRDGADIEGLDVELRFHHAGHDYIVERHLEPKLHLATLTMDGGVIEQGPIDVRKRMAFIFGMDVQGFSLATYATQSEVNGLASQSRAKRVESVNKLARADVFTKTRDDARKALNLAKNTLNKLGDAPDHGDAKAHLETKKEALKAAQLALTDTQEAVTTLTHELETKSHVQDKYKKASQAAAKAEGALAAAQMQVEQAEADHQQAQAALGERPNLPDGDMMQLQADHDELVLLISQATTAATWAKELEALATQRKSLASRLDKLDLKVNDTETPETLEAAIKQLEASKIDAVQQVESLTQEAQDYDTDLAVVDTKLTMLTADRVRFNSIHATCPTCEQEVPDSHKQSIEQSQADKQAELETKKENIKKQIEAIKTELATQQQEVTSISNNLDVTRQKLTEATRLRRELATAAQSLDDLDERIKSIGVVETYDLEGLKAEDAQVLAELTAIREAEQAVREWERKRARVEETQSTLQKAQESLTAAQEAHDSISIPQALLDEVEAVYLLAEQLGTEKELLAECTTTVKVLEQQVTAAEKEEATVVADIMKRDALRTEIELLDATSQLLASSASTISASIRPKMEGATSTLLTAMSNGRMDAVKLDRDYNIMVRRGGKFRPLMDLSGGERDLVGLAQRIGLAEVVAAANGATAPEMLILDEPFGSQDTGRRATILDGLRGLRHKFPQILLVAHVENIEDLVDTVLHVEATPAEDGEGPDTSTVIPA